PGSSPTGSPPPTSSRATSSTRPAPPQEEGRPVSSGRTYVRTTPALRTASARAAPSGNPAPRPTRPAPPPSSLLLPKQTGRAEGGEGVQLLGPFRRGNDPQGPERARDPDQARDRPQQQPVAGTEDVVEHRLAQQMVQMDQAVRSRQTGRGQVQLPPHRGPVAGRPVRGQCHGRPRHRGRPGGRRKQLEQPAQGGALLG